MRFFFLGLLAAAAFPQEPAIRLVPVADGFTAPTDIQQPEDGSNRLFVAQQGGRIRVLKDGALTPQPFLDISDRTTGGGERGLLGLAFPPDYARKQYFYLNYTNLQGDTVIARYRTTANPDLAGHDSEQILMTIRQPFANHNGGQLRFGPDGYLYIGMGDGGSGGDPMNNGQNRQALLGKLLRVDVESDLNQVRVPPDNPFVNDPAARPEIWAYGLRNPWRFSFDRETHDLWIADVGQNSFEEVNFRPASSRGGENYGWNQMEGTHCFLPNCSPDGLVLPILDYGHGDGCSVTGGFVYRGSRSADLRGMYLYGDYCSGKIWGVRREGGRWVNRLLLDSDLTITTFGENRDGEVYVADAGRGVIYHIEGTAPARPSFTAASVVNAASNAAGIVPGSIATVFATGLLDAGGTIAAERLPLPVSLGGISLTVNGRAAPLFAVARTSAGEQINFQAPFETAGGRATLVISRGAAASAPVEVPVLAAQPGVFSTNVAEAIAVHGADNALVSRDNPARRGELLTFYATGLGPVENNPGTGNAAPRDPLARTGTLPRVTLGGAPCEVLFAGLAPGFAGLYQVNIRVPDGTPAGDAELVVTVGDAAGRAVRVPLR